MIKRTPQKMNKSNISHHDDVQYHRMTAQNDGFVDMQVGYTITYEHIVVN